MRPLVTYVRGHPSTHCSLSPTLAYRLLPSSHSEHLWIVRFTIHAVMPVFVSYQPEVAPSIPPSPFSPTQYQVRSPTTRIERRTYDRFPRLTAPYIICRSFTASPVNVIFPPLIGLLHPSPTDRRLFRRHLRCVEHTSSQESYQPTQAIHNRMA